MLTLRHRRLAKAAKDKAKRKRSARNGGVRKRKRTRKVAKDETVAEVQAVEYVSPYPVLQSQRSRSPEPTYFRKMGVSCITSWSIGRFESFKRWLWYLLWACKVITGQSCAYTRDVFKQFKINQTMLYPFKLAFCQESIIQCFQVDVCRSDQALDTAFRRRFVLRSCIFSIL